MQNVNFAVGGRMLRLSDIAQIRRAFADPPQPMFRVNGKPAIGLAIAMRDGGDILALGKNITQAMATATADLPIGIEPKLVADQAVTVESAIDEFMTSLWQAVAIILAVSFISLGVRPGLVIALSIPLTLAIVFSVMDLVGIDMQRISLGALIIALALLVDDAMTTTDATLNRLAAGDDKVAAATFAFRTYAFSMLAGTLVTIAGFVPVGFAASSAGEYTFSLFAVVSIALIVSWFVAVVFAPLLGVAILKPPKAAEGGGASKILDLYRGLLTRAVQREVGHDCADAGAVRRVYACPPPDPEPVLPVLGPARAARRSAASAERIDLRQRGRGRAPRQSSRWRHRCRPLEHLCRAGRHPLLSAARRPASQRFLRPGRDRRQGRRGPRTAAHEIGESSGQ